ncbi:MAG: polymer-forming cytoskeletal protein [Vicinamibacteria bacterium]|nr:polymer-forming cytoskeletal protein [Vicinamibacteria bacterium]
MFWRRRRESEEQPAAPAPSRRFTDTLGDPTSVLAENVKLRGEITGFDSIAIDGSMDGNVAVRGYCHVRESGRVQGRVTAHHVIVSGRLEGKISARQRVELRSKAHVRADISAESVAIAEGAFFDGRIQMRTNSGKTSFFEKRRAGQPAGVEEQIP